jgi:hypothetical protein
MMAFLFLKYASYLCSGIGFGGKNSLAIYLHWFLLH